MLSQCSATLRLMYSVKASMRFVCILEGRNGDLDPPDIVCESLVYLSFDLLNKHPYSNVGQALLGLEVNTHESGLGTWPCSEVQHEGVQGIFL